MKLRVPFFVTLLIVLVPLFPRDEIAFCQERSKIKSWIDVQRNDSELILIGKFVNNTGVDEEFTYQLVAEKKGLSGRSSSKQSGRFQAEGHQEVLLSQMKFNIDPKDVYKALLTITDGEILVASDSIFYPRSE